MPAPDHISTGIRVALLSLLVLSQPGKAEADRPQFAKAREFYRETARKEALRHDIPFPLVDAVMEVESGYDPLARGSTGEVGLMQVMPQTAVLLGFKGSAAELAEPAVNIALGTRYLAQAWRLARNDICTTVMKYRAGHGESRFSGLSVRYCARVRAHLQTNGFRVSGDLPRVNSVFAQSGPATSTRQPSYPKLKLAAFSGLSAFGDWISYGNGHVWLPSNIQPGWRPYTVGRWALTQRYGWMWVSDEPFGWATYHYGRWGFDKDTGWYWVQDRHWSPAWVSWRRSARHIAWAPLPPSGSGADVSANIECCLIPVDRWTAVPVKKFLEGNLSSIVVNDALRGAEPLGSVRVENHIVVNRVFSSSFIEQQTNRKVPVYDVKQVGNTEQMTRDLGNQIAVFRPK